MLEHQIIDGKKVTVVFLDSRFNPVSKDVATLIKVIYSDGGVEFNKVGRPINLTKLEDRMLVLQDRLDVLQKEFDPNQPRDTEGQWAKTGVNIGNKVMDHARAKGKLTANTINAAVNHVANNKSDVAKEALSHAAAWAISYFSGSSPDYEAVQTSLSAFGSTAEMSAAEVRDGLVSVLQRLRVMNKDNLEKTETEAVKASVDRYLAEVIRVLKSMKLDDKAPKGKGDANNK